ncbi:signal peptidase I [Halostagnicola bangensis]
MSSPIQWGKYALVFVLVLFIGLTLVGQLIGQPMLVFVETGSMEPTLDPGDGYVAVPAMFAGEVSEGDVILFEAEELGDGGELTTHRVDRVTDEGYITKGDANPFTDQEDEEPPVQEGQIQAVGLTASGDLVVVPGLGSVVETTSGVMDTTQDRLFSSLGLEPPGTTGFAVGVLALSGLLFLVSSATEMLGRGSSDGRSRGSSARTGGIIILVLMLIILIPINLSMLLPSGVYQYEIVSSSGPDDDEQTIEAGTSAEVSYPITNGGQIPVFVIVEPASEGAHVDQNEYYVPRQSVENASVTMDAPEETGMHYRFVEETRYLVFLPPSLIGALHAIHPVVALFAINAPIALVLALIGISTLGTGRMRLRSRSRNLTLSQEIHRKLSFPSLFTRRPDRPAPPPLWKSGTSTSAHTPEDDVETDAAGTTPTPERTNEFDEASLSRYGWIEGVVQTPPNEIGLDGTEWTPSLLRTFLETAYDEQYTRTECRRLMGELHTATPRTYQIDTDSTGRRGTQSGSTDGWGADEP